jgi:hypothetical protein
MAIFAFRINDSNVGRESKVIHFSIFPKEQSIAVKVVDIND